MTSRQPGMWRSLPLPATSDVPMLLVSTEIGPSAYTVRVSDMANIWEESLDRKAICMRGWSENTGIDPSDTPENMTKFLACLKTALDTSQDDHGKTSLVLSPASSIDAGEDGITMKMTCPLPGFDPLKWPIHLKRQPPSAIATDLVVPLIQACLNRQSAVSSLLEIIGQKESVLAKLSDKLEAMGTGLEHVFTALSGRKKVSRVAAQDRVKGLAPFDEVKWKKGLDNVGNGPSGINELVQDVFGETGLEVQCTMDLEKSPELDKWWHNFVPTKRGPQLNTTTKLPTSKKRTPSPMYGSTKINDDEDNEFQVQSTPPHLRSADKDTTASEVPPADDTSTDGGEESIIPESKRVRPLSDRRRQPETTKKNSRLGAIGGKKQPAPPRSPSPSPSPSPAKCEPAKPPVDDDETASEASDEDVTAAIPDSSPAPSGGKSTTKSTPKKGSLGKIGGGAVTTRAAKRESTPEVEPPVVKGTPSKKLGTIGGKPSVDLQTSEEDRIVGRGRVTQRVDSTMEETPREKSVERADRKREELKRELERKSAAGPAKKKRRF